MSDNNSVSGSVRAGYRRSRIEPVDPSTISAPKAPTPPHNSPVLAKPQETEQKEGICKKILRGIFLLLNIFVMTLAILMIIMGVTLWIIFRSSGMSILDVAGGASIGNMITKSIYSLSLALIINGILLTLFAGWGCEVAMISGRKKAIFYLIGLVIMYGFSLFTYFRANRIGESIQDNLNQYWGTFSTTTRSMIQDFVRF